MMQYLKCYCNTKNVQWPLKQTLAAENTWCMSLSRRSQNDKKRTSYKYLIILLVQFPIQGILKLCIKTLIKIKLNSRRILSQRLVFFKRISTTPIPKITGCTRQVWWVALPSLMRCYKGTQKLTCLLPPYRLCSMCPMVPNIKEMMSNCSNLAPQCNTDIILPRTFLTAGVCFHIRS